MTFGFDFGQRLRNGDIILLKRAISSLFNNYKLYLQYNTRLLDNQYHKMYWERVRDGHYVLYEGDRPLFSLYRGLMKWEYSRKYPSKFVTLEEAFAFISNEVDAKRLP